MFARPNMVRDVRFGSGTTILTKTTMSALPPKADIRDDVNEKERPPCGGLSQAVRDVRYAALDF
jgi:hypothetical protein